MLRKSFTLACLVFLPACGCAANRFVANPDVVIDKDRCEVCLSAVVQKTDAPRMSDWAQAGPALLGARDGKYADHFVFLTAASASDVYDALSQLGARARVSYTPPDAAPQPGNRPDESSVKYLPGDPVQIFVHWEADGQVRRVAYEDFFNEKAVVSR